MADGRPTIKDVAAQAGMSTLTVSRVINNHPSIKLSTRLRVEAAMRALNYEPNAAAQSMRRGSSRTIGFLMPDFAHGVSAFVAQNVERVLHKAGYTVMLACSHFDPATECNALRTFERNRVDAVLLKTCDESSPEIIERVQSMSCPVVLVDRDLPGAVDAVVSDHAAAMRQAVRHLLELGHRDIALIAPSSKMRPGRERIAGFRQAMQEAGLTVPSDRLVDGGNSETYAYDAIMSLMDRKRRPTALIAAGNQILFGAIEALKRLRLTFPDDVSLLGADHPRLGRVMSPTITMIDREPARLAEAAADSLLVRLAGRQDGDRRYSVLSSRIIPGDSCRRLEA
ncbi:LacI family DNA-binding transcriptional regulator [Chelativorans sp. AA-79]|uniref:LacI family DNA-binding transcriptional regulator n=1 Tax=Chelativorans sp. AA-79 TaxID=3028735 RepID=UPI0023F7672F|nr:LacI family DNA-binding transcriptional regulator [Chelativorans sp. AA-79]WEX10964.1 LacI family DNA-binding transcriptional regulator [Chelativorans sp. AA-79]